VGANAGDQGPATPDGVVIGEAASHGGMFGIVIAAVAALIAAVVLRAGKRSRQ
jgi:hypothetical protein